MAAQLQGLLIGRAVALLAAVALAACAGPPHGVVTTPEVAVPAGETLPVTPPVIAPLTPPELPQGLGPEILLPRQDAVDGEVARVGDLVLRQSHAYTRLLSAHPKLALSAVDLLVFDVLVARHAEQFDIRVSEERVEALAAEEEQDLRRQVAAELVDVPFGDYIWRLFGMREQDWRTALRLRTAQRLYQGYVLRYLALREDRVQVRFLVNKNRDVVQEVADKVRVGADFATLALRSSEDPSRRDGGLLPPFGRGFRHPAATHAFELQKGEVSNPFQAEWGGEKRWFVVYCLEHKPGRDVPFSAVQREIDEDLVQQPITPVETTAYTLRWRHQAGVSNAAESGGDAIEGKQ